MNSSTSKKSKSFYRHFIAPLFSNIRFYILSINVLLSVIIFFWIKAAITDPTLRTIRLQQVYSLFAVIYLYIALLATPLTKVFENIPFRDQYLHARRALGVSAFYFALLHALLAFYGQLGGFNGLQFFNSKYLYAIGAAVIALVILFLMAITSFDWAVEKLSFRRWKMLHRFVYIAGLLTLYHIVILGTHFSDLSSAIPRILMVALIFLLILESLRFEKTIRKLLPKIQKPSYIGLIFADIIFLGLGVFIGLSSIKSTSSGGGLNVGIHAQHLQLAQQSQNQTINNPTGNSALIGDPSKHFDVSFLHDDITPGVPTQLRFKIYGASSGETITNFQKLFDKVAHLVIVDESLKYYSHIHPEIDPVSGTMVVTTTFPQAAKYRLYLNFQPNGAIEQQFGFNLTTGSTPPSNIDEIPVDTSLTKQFSNYDVSIGSLSYSAKDLSAGKQQVIFKITDANNNKPVTTLKPYLAAFGHLALIHESTYDYIHVHPTIRSYSPDENSGPNVAFLPLGLYGSIKPGKYRMFAQFNPNNQLITADFTVKVVP